MSREGGDRGDATPGVTSRSLASLKSNAASRPGTATCSRYTSRSGAVLNPPLAEPPLQRPQLSWLEPTRMPPAQRTEQRQPLQPPVCVGHQLRHDLGLPHVDERVLPRPPRPRRRRRRRQRPALSLRGRPLAHPGCRRGRRQRLPCHPLSRNPRTCASVTNPSSTRKTAVSHASRAPPAEGRSPPRRPAK